MKVEEVESRVVLVDRVVVVVAPEVEGPHLVPLMVPAGAPALHHEGGAGAGVAHPRVAPAVGVALEAAPAPALCRAALRCAAPFTPKVQA